MPELPDVEVWRRYVDATSLHRVIDDVFLRERLVTGVEPHTLRVRLRGATAESTRRHGKHLFVRIRSAGPGRPADGAARDEPVRDEAAGDEDGWLRLHFGMTGSLCAYDTGPQPSHTELRLDFDDGGHLAYLSQRRFGEISWVDDVDAFVAAEHLGPDPLAPSFDAGELVGALRTRRGSLKGALMDQSFVAGLGNVYVDEILFQAGLHPRMPASSLGDTDAEALSTAMASVIAEAISAGARVEDLPEDWLVPHRHADEPCPRCGGHIERVTVSGRATYLCPSHQHAPPRSASSASSAAGQAGEP